MSKRSLFRMSLCALVSPALILSTGCSAFQSSHQRVTIVPSPADARVYVNGEERGTGTVSVMLPRDESHSVMAKRGNRTGTATVHKKISGTGIADIVGTVIFIVPVIGVFTPGFWTLDPKTVTVVVPTE
jgi:hypothetical protein